MNMRRNMSHAKFGLHDSKTKAFAVRVQHPKSYPSKPAAKFRSQILSLKTREAIKARNSKTFTPGRIHWGTQNTDRAMKKTIRTPKAGKIVQMGQKNNQKRAMKELFVKSPNPSRKFTAHNYARGKKYSDLAHGRHPLVRPKVKARTMLLTAKRDAADAKILAGFRSSNQKRVGGFRVANRTVSADQSRSMWRSMQNRGVKIYRRKGMGQPHDLGGGGNRIGKIGDYGGLSGSGRHYRQTYLPSSPKVKTARYLSITSRQEASRDALAALGMSGKAAKKSVFSKYREITRTPKSGARIAGRGDSQFYHNAKRAHLAGTRGNNVKGERYSNAMLFPKGHSGLPKGRTKALLTAQAMRDGTFNPNAKPKYKGGLRVAHAKISNASLARHYGTREARVVKQLKQGRGSLMHGTMYNRMYNAARFGVAKHIGMGGVRRATTGALLASAAAAKVAKVSGAKSRILRAGATKAFASQAARSRIVHMPNRPNLMRVAVGGARRLPMGRVALAVGGAAAVGVAAVGARRYAKARGRGMTRSQAARHAANVRWGKRR
jgi:hypothetical protein